MAKKKDQGLIDDAVIAQQLGLSYGEYSAYKASGYLKRYIADRNRKKKDDREVNVIPSKIIGASNVGGIRSRDDRKMA